MAKNKDPQSTEFKVQDIVDLLKEKWSAYSARFSRSVNVKLTNGSDLVLEKTKYFIVLWLDINNRRQSSIILYMRSCSDPNWADIYDRLLEIVKSLKILI